MFPVELARALGVDVKEVDSLMVVELRNWIWGGFEATVAVFEIIGCISIKAIEQLVVKNSCSIISAHHDKPT